MWLPSPLQMEPLGIDLPARLRVAMVQVRGPFRNHKDLRPNTRGRDTWVWLSTRVKDLRIQRAFSIIDQLNAYVDTDYRKPDIIVFPEYAVPLTTETIELLRLKAKNTQQIFIATDNVDDGGTTEALVFVPDGSPPRRVPKLKPSPLESHLSKAPPGTPVKVFTWQHADRTYALAIRVCFDLLDLHVRDIPHPVLVIGPMQCSEMPRFIQHAHDWLETKVHRDGAASILCNGLGEGGMGMSSIVALLRGQTTKHAKPGSSNPAVELSKQDEACAVVEIDMNDLPMAQASPVEGPERGLTLRWRMRLTGTMVATKLVAWQESTPPAESSSPPDEVEATGRPAGEGLQGWEILDARSLDALPPLESTDVDRFFDGAVPTWRHAVSPAIPERQAVERLVSLFLESHAQARPSIHLIRAAGGEGKSTILLQVAAQLAKQHGWRVLSRCTPNAGLHPESVLSLGEQGTILVAVDDAANLVDSLGELAAEIHKAGRGDVHILVASGDADWRATEGDKIAWDQWIDSHVLPPKATVLRGITDRDAGAIVASWRRAGSLRGLSNVLPSHQARELIAAVQDEETKQVDDPQGGSFFGGLLTVRYPGKALQSHLRGSLRRLIGIRIADSPCSLFDALLFIAATHAAGIGLDEKILADVVGVKPERVASRVLRPLGEEAVAKTRRGLAVTRHSRVAAAIVDEADRVFQRDPSEEWRDIVTKALARWGSQEHVSALNEVVYSADAIRAKYADILGEVRAQTIAVDAAAAAVAAQPTNLRFIVSLAFALRKANRLNEADELLERTQTKIEEFRNGQKAIRGFYLEWGVLQGVKRESLSTALESMWLIGLSASDEWPDNEMEESYTHAVMGAFGKTLSKLALDMGAPFTAALRAVAYMGIPMSSTSRNFEVTAVLADRLGVPQPASLHEAVAWLAEGIRVAGGRVERPALRSLADPADLTFGALETKLVTLRRRGGLVSYPKDDP